MNKKLVSLLTAAVVSFSPLAVSATEFTPSAEVATHVAEITNTEAENPVTEEELKDGSLILEITPIEDINDAGLPSSVKENLINARDELKNNDLSALVPDLPDADDYAVDAIFDISLVDVAPNQVVEPNGDITLTTKIDVEGDYILLHDEDGTWKMVPVTHNSDGTVTFTVPNLSPFAVIVKKESSNPGTTEPSVNPSTPTTPSTTDNTGKTPSAPSASDTHSDITSNPGTSSAVHTSVKPGTTGSQAEVTPASSTTAQNNQISTPAAASSTNKDAATKDTGTQDVATAANSNWMIAAAGTAAGLAGIVLILKARKGLAK